MMNIESKRKILRQVGDGSIVALGAIILGTIFGLSFSYVVIFLSSPILYGLVAILGRISPVVTRAFGGVDTGLNRTLPRLETKEQNAIITTAFILGFVGCAIAVGGLLFGMDTLFKFTALEPSHSFAVWVFAGSLPLVVTIRLSASVFRSYKQIRLANLISTVGKPLSKVLGVVIGLVFVSNSLFGLWTGVLISTGIVTVGAIGLLFKYTPFSVTSPFSAVKVVKEFFVYIRDSTVGTLAGLVQHQGVFILMMVLLQPIEAGLFSLSIILIRIIRWPLSAVNQIFPPIMTELYDSGEMTELNNLYKETTRLLVFAVLPLTAFLVLYARDILTVFSSEYASYVVIIPILAIGQVVAVAIGSVGLLLMMTDHQRESMWLQIGLDIVFIPIGIFLSIEYGIIGLAITYSVMYAVNNIAELLLLHRKTGLFPFTMTHGKIIGFAIVVFSVVAVAGGVSKVVGLLTFGLGTLIYLKVAYTYLLHDSERMILTAVLQTLQRKT